MSYHKPKKPAKWVLERIRNRLAYDENVCGLIWTTVHTGRGNNQVKVGDTAGTLDNGYLRICFSDSEFGHKTVKVHHIVWYLVTGEWPTEQIDHRDENRANNHFDNLRLASCSQQNINHGVRADNKLGEKNICYRKKRQTFAVQISRDKKVVLYKEYKTIEEAITVRDRWYRENGCAFSRT